MFLKAIYVFVVILFWSVLAGYLARNSGEVEILFLNWKIITSVPVLVIIGILFTLILYYLIRFYKKLKRYILFIFGKKSYPIYSKKGYELLASSQLALAKGDIAKAKRYADKAEAMLLGSPLALMASSQVLEMSGKEKAALRKYKKMADNPKSEILGLKGLIDYALGKEKYDEAYVLIRRAFELKKDSPWVIKNKFELEVKKELFIKAEKSLKLAKKYKIYDDETYNRLMASVLFKRSEENNTKAENEEKNRINLLGRAVDFNKKLIPAYIRLAKIYLSNDDVNNMTKILEKGFSNISSKEIGDFYYKFWKELLSGEKDTKKAYSYMKDFTMSNKKSPLSIVYRLKSALFLGMLDKAEDLIKEYDKNFSPIKEFLILKADYLDITHKDNGMVITLLKEATTLKEHENYRCSHCKTEFDEWNSFCPICETFGSIYLEKNQ